MVGFSSRFITVAAIALASLVAGCERTPPPAAEQKTPPASSAVQAVQPGAPGHDSTLFTHASIQVPPHTAADTAFMEGMIHHHAQAVEMVELLNKNTDTPAMKLLGQRISISQNDEIRMMKNWLTERHEAVPEEHPDHSMTMPMAGMPGMSMPMEAMPGMLSEAQMAALANAKGKAFDKLFLEGMIQHHGGALVMVQDLFAAPGAGQDSIVFDFASHVDADQRMEITRMRKMLEEMK